jgi:hypothetical protein
MEEMGNRGLGEVCDSLPSQGGERPEAVALIFG